MAAAGNNPAVLSPETLPMYHVKKRKEVRKGDSPIPFAGTTSIGSSGFGTGTYLTG